MTTTLRPTEPLTPGPDGALSRHYDVCVNSRPVGGIHLATDPVFGPAVAVLRDLRIDEADRGRGRGTVAALAAEEVVRGWGCARIEMSVPAAAKAAYRLAQALGYTLRNRGMEKHLAADPPAPAAGTRARPLTAEEYADWYAAAQAGYARSWVSRGVPPAEAAAKSAEDHRRLLPQGQDTPGTLLRTLEHDGEPVGTLWLSVRDTRAFVFNVGVAPAHRGKGHGRALMLLAEAEAAAAGHTRLGLNVFAGNAPAERLYESLGYRTTTYHVYKALA